jgi:hypothetical protein
MSSEDKIIQHRFTTSMKPKKQIKTVYSTLGLHLNRQPNINQSQPSTLRPRHAAGLSDLNISYPTPLAIASPELRKRLEGDGPSLSIDQSRSDLTNPKRRHVFRRQKTTSNMKNG